MNPENKHEQSFENLNQSSCKITKCKGKPFWLNLSKKKMNYYEKYKT